MKHFYTNSLKNRPNTERRTLGNENQQNRYGKTHALKSNLFSMRKRVVVVFMLLVVCLGGTAWGQTSLTVNDGTATSSTIPMYGLYFDDYAKSECIIPSTSLTAMNGRTITAMTFYVSSSSTGEWDNTNQKVFLKEVAGTNLGGSYSGMNGATIVFDGRLPLPHATGAYTINFTTPYTYNGGNLLIGVYNDDDGTYHGIQWYGISGLTSGVSAYGYNANNLNNASYNAQQFLPKVTFLFPCHPSFSSTTDYITNIALGSINNTSGFSTGGYGSYTNLSTNVLRGNTVNLSLTSSSGSGNHGAAVWIDFNDNGEFETSERVGTYPNSIQPNTTVQIPLTIPANAALGRHTLRVVYRYATAGTSIEPCVSAGFGEGEDYTVNITQPCTPSFSSSSDYITRIVLGSINNSTGFSTGGYGNYTNLSTNLQPGGTATMSLSSSSGTGTHAAAVWIDFNDNGLFETSERVGTLDGIGPSTTVDITLTIPADAPTGNHTMRIVYQYSVTATSIDPCPSASYGEGEDYTVNIISCTTRTANITNCPGTMISGQQLSLNGTVSAGGGTATWSSSNTGILSLSGNTVTAGTPGTATITYTRGANGGYCAVSTTCQITVNCATNNQTFAFNTTTGSVAEDATLNIAGYLTVPTGATVTSYTSANTSIATVTNAGVVTGVSSGTTTITATIAQWTYDGVTYCQRTTTNSFTVTVTSDCDESFNLSGNMTKTINCGTTYCFYDSGGKNGSYSNNEDYIAEFSSSGDITITFSSYNTEAYYDYLTIYDGPNGGTQLFYGYGVLTIPAPVTATSGTMTVVWHSDVSGTYGGWKAKITATDCCTQSRSMTMSGCQNRVFRPGETMNLSASVTPSGSGGTITWHSSDESVATVDGNGVVTVIGTGTATVTATISSNGVWCRASAECVINASCTETIILNDDKNVEVDCSGAYCFYDSGGENGSYSNNEDYTATFTSAGEITITFSSFSTESNYDKISIYDGGTSGTVLLNSYSGTTVPGPFTATSGTLTVVWHSDVSNTYGGWKAIITATGCCTSRTGDFEFCRASVNATTSTPDFTVPLTNAVTPGGTVSYISSNPDVATVDATGTVHPVANGATTITASIPAATISGTDYCAITASYVVKVGTPGGGEGCDDIGTGTNSDADGLGVTTLYQYAWVEMIYTADELNLGSSCSITSIAFRVDGTNSEMTEPQSTKIYIGLTDKSQFDDDYDFVSPAGGAMTIVYNETWTLHDGWNVFTFNTPFAYTDNTKNLIVGVLCLNDDYWCTDYIYYTESPNRLIQAYEDDYVPDPENMGSYYGYRYVLNLRPDIRICTNCTFTPTEFPSVSLSPDETQIVCKTSDVASAINDITVTSVGETVTLTPSDKGLSYSTSTHKITGIPNFTGTQEFNITVKDADDCLKDEKTFTITVNQLNATIQISNP